MGLLDFLGSSDDDEERKRRKVATSGGLLGAPEKPTAMKPDVWRLAGQSAALVPFWTAGGLLQAGKGVPPLFQAAVQGPLTAEAWREATYFPELYKYMSTLDGAALMQLLLRR